MNMDVVDAPPGTPWWAWLLGVVLVALIVACGGAVGTYFVHRFATRPKLDSIAADAAEAKNQTANSHDTNFRDDVDQKFRATNGRLDRLSRRQLAADKRAELDRREAAERHQEVMDRITEIIDGPDSES